jgi:hypothetical protein
MHWGINRENKRTGNILSNFLFRPAVRRGGLRVWFFSQSLRDAKELLRLVYNSRKMEKVGFLCGFAPLRDQKFFKGLAKAGGK